MILRNAVNLTIKPELRFRIPMTKLHAVAHPA